MGAAGDMLTAALLELHPDPDGFLPRFIAAYLPLLARVQARVPALALTERLARDAGGWPPPFAADPTAPTRGAIAPLELAAEALGVPPDTPDTPRLLALTLLGSFDRDPSERFEALFRDDDTPAVGPAAMAAAEPAAFVTALVCRALSEMDFF